MYVFVDRRVGVAKEKESIKMNESKRKREANDRAYSCGQLLRKNGKNNIHAYSSIMLIGCRLLYIVLSANVLYIMCLCI